MLRSKRGRASIPFDWSKGFDVRDIIGPITIKNQGTSDSCAGQAGAYFLEIQRRLQQIKEGAISAKSIYAPIAYQGGGTTVKDLENQIAFVGANLESSVPSYDATGAPLSEAMMIEKSWRTPAMNVDALHRAGYTTIDLAEDIDEIAAAVRDYGAVLWELEGENNGTWLSADPNPPAGTGEPWYHFMCVIGAMMTNGQKTLIVLNSWGDSVGDNGVQHFHQNYFDDKGIVDAFSFVYDKNITPAPNNSSLLADIIRWFQQQFLLWKVSPS